MDSATVARGLALVLSLILSLILATLPASALNFRVTHPPRGSTWPTGSLLDVRWSLDNVTLPLPDLRVHIDLYDAQGSYVQQIATNLANEGLFQWTVPLALDLSRGGGYALVVGGVDVRGEEQGVGSSGAVHVVDVQAARGSVALLVVEPKRDRRFFAGEPVHVVWTRSSAYPQLPWGVHVELRERNGPAVLRIAENVTFNGAETSSVEWVVPDALPLAPGDVEFQGYVCSVPSMSITRYDYLTQLSPRERCSVTNAGR